MFIAVGDEGRQWVDMVGVLHHRDFIGLLKRKKKRRRNTVYEQKVTNMQNIYQYISSKQSPSEATVLVAKTLLLSHTRHMHMISVGHCSEQKHGVNRPSCVSALHGKHHSLRVTGPVMQSGPAPRNTKKACRRMPRPLRSFS